MPQLDAHLVEVDGAGLEVLTGGTAGPPLCLVPHPLLPPTRDAGVLGGLGRVVTMSPRGLGRSAAGECARDLTIDRLVDDLEAVRRQLGLERWALYGASGGGEVLLRYALRYPDAVSAMVLAGCPPGFNRILDDPRTPLSPGFPDWRCLLERRLLPTAYACWVWSLLVPGVWVLAEHGRPRLAARGIAESGPSARDRAVWKEVATFRFGAGDLEGLRIPALVLHGRHDAVVPLEYGAELSATLPLAELVVFERSEHDVSRAEPERFREVVGRFLAATLPA